jgi:hypothetical protein
MAVTPPKDLYMAIFYWLVVYYVTLLPVLIKRYEVRLAMLTFVVPNALRMIVNRMPRLAVDRLILTYILHLIFKKTRKDMDEFGKDVKKTLEVSGLLTATFIAGALLTYYMGLDRSIYSNLNWE